MDKVSLAWGALAVYVAVTLVLTYRGWRQTRSVEGFVVGNRNISPVFVGLSLAAQLTSVATFVINPGLIYAYGLSGLLGLGLAAGLGIMIGVVLLSKGFRAVGESVSALTVPAWLGNRYRSSALRVGFALLSLALVTFMVLIVVAISAVLAHMLQVPAWAAMGVLIFFVFSYVLLGGINTSAYTNSIQALIMVVVALVLIASGLPLLADGIGPFLARLAAIDPVLASVTNPQSLYFRNLFEVFVCNFIVGLAIVCQPHVVVKALSLKSSADLRRYLLTAIGTGVIFLLVMVSGLYARLKLGDGIAIDAVIPTYIATQFSSTVSVVIAVGVLCAGISTLEGLILALSAILATDLFQPLLRHRRATIPAVSDLLPLRLARLSLLVIAVVTFVVALYQIKHPTGGSVAIFAQYGIYGLFSASFAPMVFGIFLRGPLPSWIPGASSLVALGVYVGMSLGQVTSMYNNPAVLSTFSILASLLTMSAGVVFERLTRRTDIGIYHPGPDRPVSDTARIP